MSDSAAVLLSLNVTTFASMRFWVLRACISVGSLLTAIVSYAIPKMPSIWAIANCVVSEVISENVNCFTVKSPSVTSSTESLPLTDPEPYSMLIAVPSAFHVELELEF